MEEITKYNRIKAALADAGKTNRQLADFMGVHPTTVSDWCTNKNQPRFPELFQIAEFLQINVRLLLLPTYWDERSIAAEDEPVFKKPRKKKAVAKKKSRK
jgi:putative transcriptional regulator